MGEAGQWLTFLAFFAMFIYGLLWLRRIFRR